MVQYSIVIPVLNEEENLELLMQELTRAMQHDPNYEIIFINDGSTDGSLDLMKKFHQEDPRVKVISLSRNFGQEAAFSSGIKYAEGQWVIQIDADLQNPPQEILKLIEKAKEGYDIVYGVRENRQDSLYRVSAARLAKWLAHDLFKIRLPKEASAFRIVKTAVAKRIIHLPEKHKYFIALAGWTGATYASVYVQHDKRYKGKSKWKFRALFNHTLDLYIAHSQVLIRWIGKLGLTGVLLAILLGGIELFLHQHLWVYALLLLLGGVQLASLSILGEYIGRITTQVQDRNIFLIREAYGMEICPEDRLYYGESAGGPKSVLAEVVS